MINAPLPKSARWALSGYDCLNSFLRTNKNGNPLGDCQILKPSTVRLAFRGLISGSVADLLSCEIFLLRHDRSRLV